MGMRRKQPQAVDPVRLHVAHHELGHMIGWTAMGRGIRHVRIWGHGRNTEGEVVTVTSGELLQTPDQCRTSLVGLLAGPQADMRYCTLTGTRFDPVHSKDDMRAFRRLHKHKWVRDLPVAELEQAARDLILEHWDEITQLAPRLAEQGHL